MRSKSESAVRRIAHFLDRSDELPNQELARDLALRGDSTGIREIVASVRSSNRSIAGDCIKVLYEVGYIEPRLIAPHTELFIELLESGHNRLVWGAMIALSRIAEVEAARLSQHVSAVIRATGSGSVITVDNGVRVLALIAAEGGRQRSRIVAWLLRHLGTCRAKDVPMHAEKMRVAFEGPGARAFVAALETRMKRLTPAQAARVRRVLRRSTMAA
jgi:hypothetical protein